MLFLLKTSISKEKEKNEIIKGLDSLKSHDKYSKSLWRMNRS